jgi:hypothetical protein
LFFTISKELIYKTLFDIIEKGTEELTFDEVRVSACRTVILLF